MDEANGAGRWPDGYRAALCVSIDVDGRYGETNARNPDAFWIHQTAYDPTGTARLLDLLADAGVSGTFCWVGRVAEEGPDLVRRAIAEGHEVACHSWDHRAYNGLGPDEQRADIERTREALARIAGVAPVGHKSPGWRYDEHTFPLLQTLGFAWAMDEPGGDLPYFQAPDPALPPLVQLPPSWLYDDYPFFVDRMLTPAHASDFWREDLDQLRAEGKLMCLTLHPFVGGRPGPSRAVARLLDHAIDAGDIWIARADQIAAWWREQAGAEQTVP
jgi:peptidoglycan/xylan/chitin deacetylase (PgdA/CDA1 family)